MWNWIVIADLHAWMLCSWTPKSWTPITIAARWSRSIAWARPLHASTITINCSCKSHQNGNDYRKNYDQLHFNNNYLSSKSLQIIVNYIEEFWFIFICFGSIPSTAMDFTCIDTIKVTFFRDSYFSAAQINVKCFFKATVRNWLCLQ